MMSVMYCYQITRNGTYNAAGRLQEYAVQIYSSAFQFSWLVYCRTRL